MTCRSPAGSPLSLARSLSLSLSLSFPPFSLFLLLSTCVSVGQRGRSTAQLLRTFTLPISPIPHHRALQSSCAAADPMPSCSSSSGNHPPTYMYPTYSIIVKC
ncbi:hypothetical protein IWZ03DRAFT_372666 [Phyllosticta citriasiana]|uniref:Secreted protein n=1 Tax=Phyllosticta citriasiana TaxID=595635 RepID=A0ABR1KWL1_9PEZI